MILESSDISKLTVQLIADRAELNRATFYLHYRDIDDLMEKMKDEVLDELHKTMLNSSEDAVANNCPMPPRARLISFLEHFYQNAGLFNVLLENKDFRKRVYGILLHIVSYWAEERKAKGNSFNVFNEIIASSTLGIISWWLEAGTPYSASYLYCKIILLSGNRLHKNNMSFQPLMYPLCLHPESAAPQSYILFISVRALKLSGFTGI